MNDKEILQSRLKTERPAVPEGFAQRQDALLGSLRRDPQPAVCRMPRLDVYKRQACARRWPILRCW